MSKTKLSEVDPQVQEGETFKVTFELSLFGPSQIVTVNDRLYTIEAFIEEFPSFAEEIRVKLGKYDKPPLNTKVN